MYGSKVTVYVDDWTVVKDETYFGDASISLGLYNFTVRSGNKVTVVRKKGGSASTICN